MSADVPDADAVVPQCRLPPGLQCVAAGVLLSEWRTVRVGQPA